jgi:hypothetical protein
LDIASVIAIALIGLFVCAFSMALSAHLSGWYSLAQRYRTLTPFAGRIWHLRAATFRSFSSYWLTLVVGANQDGLYLAQLWPLSWTHPPLLIPWHDIQFERRRWFEVGARSLLIGDSAPLRVSMSRKIVAEMQGLRNASGASV